MNDPKDDYVAVQGEEVESLEIMNRYMVGGNGQTLTVMLPVVEATPDEMLAHAAWIVTMAEPFSEHDFEEYLEAVKST
jgi:hypothetical protein